MNNKMTKKERKIAYNKKIKERKEKIKELEELKLKVSQLESDILFQKKENFKQFNIRNLKVFAQTCNLLAPFVISTEITIGLIKYLGAGYPFYLDDITSYKHYDMDYQTNGELFIEESYKIGSSDNSLTIYTPYEHTNEGYVRYKREYKVDGLKTFDLWNAILDENYNYINENLTDYKEEKQTINKISDNQTNDYFIEAKLCIEDKDDILKTKESKKRNITVTIIDLVLGLGIGTAITIYRDFNYLYEINDINERYRFRIKSIKSIEQDLEETNEKILSLISTIKNFGGKTNG